MNFAMRYPVCKIGAKLAFFLLYNFVYFIDFIKQWLFSLLFLNPHEKLGSFKNYVIRDDSWWKKTHLKTFFVFCMKLCYWLFFNCMHITIGSNLLGKFDHYFSIWVGYIIILRNDQSWRVYIARVKWDIFIENWHT